MKGNAEKNAVNNHTNMTNSIEPFNDRFVIFFGSDLKNMINPEIMHVIEEKINEYKYFEWSLNIIVLIIGIIMKMPNIIVTTAT